MNIICIGDFATLSRLTGLKGWRKKKNTVGKQCRSWNIHSSLTKRDTTSLSLIALFSLTLDDNSKARYTSSLAIIPVVFRCKVTRPISLSLSLTSFPVHERKISNKDKLASAFFSRFFKRSLLSFLYNILYFILYTYIRLENKTKIKYSVRVFYLIIIGENNKKIGNIFWYKYKREIKSRRDNSTRAVVTKCTSKTVLPNFPFSLIYMYHRPPSTRVAANMLIVMKLS